MKKSKMPPVALLPTTTFDSFTYQPALKVPAEIVGSVIAGKAALEHDLDGAHLGVQLAQAQFEQSVSLAQQVLEQSIAESRKQLTDARERLEALEARRPVFDQWIADNS